MAHINFQEVSIIGEKSGKCQCCKKSCRVKKKFYQTLNPFNRNSDGFVKSRQEIMKEINSERENWMSQPVKHKKCE